MAIDAEVDSYWIEAFVTVLDPLPTDVGWVRKFWLERTDANGQLPTDLRRDLVAEVRRLAVLENQHTHDLIEHYSAIARGFHLDPMAVTDNPFEPVGAWLATKP